MFAWAALTPSPCSREGTKSHVFAWERACWVVVVVVAAAATVGWVGLGGWGGCAGRQVLAALQRRNRARAHSHKLTLALELTHSHLHKRQVQAALRRRNLPLFARSHPAAV